MMITDLRNAELYLVSWKAVARNSGLQMHMTVLALIVCGCTGYMPGQKAYWDEQIKVLCENDGHVRILERVVLSKQQAYSMPRTEGKIALRMQITEPVNDPVYARIEKTTHLREQDPEVVRAEMVAIRQSDRQVVARWVEYSRVGGDPLTGVAHQSSFQLSGSKAGPE